MSPEPHLHLEGRLVATAEVVDSYGHDRDEWDHLFLFRSEDGYTLVSLARKESFSDTGHYTGGVLDVVVDRRGDAQELEDLVRGRWPLRSDAWWQLLDAGSHNDEELHARWVPERMRRDLERASVLDRRLALTTDFIGGDVPSAPGRAHPGWREAALETMADHLEGLGWEVEADRPVVGESAEPGGILSEATEIVGALRIRRYGWEAPVVVRVDDCGEISPRLAGRDEVRDAGVRMVERPSFPEFADVELAERFADLAVAQGRDASFGFER
ncbi:MAG: hypothetical protein AB1679_01605 [Actinomycetota bacterium]|jgi:hypothetical protein